MLQLSDFREGWRQVTIPDAEAQGSAAIATDLYECGDLKPPAPLKTARSDFQLNQFTRVTSTADLMTSFEDAELVYQAVTSERAATCTRDLFEDGLRTAGVAVVSSVVEPLPIAAEVEKASGFRVVAKIVVGSGQQVPIYVDVLVIRKGSVLMSLGLASGGSPFVAAVAADLARKMAGRA